MINSIQDLYEWTQSLDIDLSFVAEIGNQLAIKDPYGKDGQYCAAHGITDSIKEE